MQKKIKAIQSWI